MTRRLAVLAVMAVAACGAAAIGFAQVGPATTDPLPWEDPAAVALGSEIYADFCASCHGANLEGAENWRAIPPGGRAPAPPHDFTGHTWHHPSPQLIEITRIGTAAIVGNGYESDMAGFGEVLTDEEILAVLAFIKSTWPPAIIANHTEMTEAYIAATGDTGFD